MKYHMTCMISSLKGLEVDMDLHALSNSQSTAVWGHKEWLIDKQLELCITISNVSHKKSPCCSILGVIYR